MGHWECDTLIGANHKGAVATKVESKSGFGRMGKVTNKASELVNSAFLDKLTLTSATVSTLTLDNGREFSAHSHIDKQLHSTTYFARLFASLSAE